MTRLLIMGAPGAGKGTQATRLADSFGIPTISTGAIFRANISGQTELGKECQRYIEKGDFVPDSVTNAMVAARLNEDDAKNGFLLDGYPRTVEQVAALDEMLAASGHKLDAAVELTVDPEAVVGRLLKRAEIEGRADDTEPVIRHRLDVYAESTAPLLKVYADRGLLVKVDGMGEVDEVAVRIKKQLDEFLGR